MEKLIQSLVENGELTMLILITIFSVIICFYKYGGELISIFKRKKNERDVRYEELVHRVIEDSKSREVTLNRVIENNQTALDKNQKILETTNKINQELAATNKELSKTNRELFNKISFKIDAVEDKIENINEDVQDMKESITVIRTRTEK